MRKRIIIFGGGFISKNISNSLNPRFDISVITKNECNLENFDELNLYMKKFCEKSIFIISASVTRLKENSKKSYNQNLKIINNICNLDYFTKIVDHVIFLSTVDVYGINPVLPITEKNNVSPSDYYSKSKLVSEGILRDKLQSNDLTILRLVGVYGAYETSKSTITALINSVINNNKVIIDNNVYRDYVSVDYVVKITEEIINKKIKGLYNVASGNSFTLEDISISIFNFTHIKPNIVVKQKNLKNIRQQQLIFDVSLLLLNFKKHYFKKSLNNYINKGYI